MTKKLEKIKQTFDFGFCPIVYTTNSIDCSTVWMSAKQKTDVKYPDFTAHSWRVGENDKPILVYSQDNYHDALLYFWEQLKDISGTKWQLIQKYFIELSSEEVAELNQ